MSEEYRDPCSLLFNSFLGRLFKRNDLQLIFAFLLDYNGGQSYIQETLVGTFMKIVHLFHYNLLAIRFDCGLVMVVGVIICTKAVNLKWSEMIDG